MVSGYLIFALSGLRFGVKLTGALEILTWRPSKKVPLSHPYIDGLLDYRDQVYPIFDLRQRLGVRREAAPVGEGRSIILLEAGGKTIGIGVDAVEKMAKLEDPSGAPPRTSDVDRKFLKGWVSEDGGEIMILDVERLLHAG